MASSMDLHRVQSSYQTLSVFLSSYLPNNISALTSDYSSTSSARALSDLFPTNAQSVQTRSSISPTNENNTVIF